MSDQQLAAIGAGALVVVPLVTAIVLIAVGPRARPRYARAHGGIDERGSSASRPGQRTSPESAASADAPPGASTEPSDLGLQALRDAVGVHVGRGAEVIG